MQFQTTLTFLHTENIEWKDKKTNEQKKGTLVYLADPKTGKVTKFSFKGDATILEAQTKYIANLEYYTSDRGSGVSLKSLTPTK